MGKNVDLTNQIFGRLKVIGDSGERKWGQKMWLCECSCKDHTHLLVCGGNLKSGHTKSCGCLSIETSIANGKAQRKYNTFIEHEDYVEGFDIPGNSFIIDKEDLEEVSQYYWSFSQATGYWTTTWSENKTKYHLKLHQLICKGTDGIKIVPDHIDRNPSNNRRSNLRPVTRRDNSLNSGLQSNNKSGIIGVSWSNPEQKWRATISKGNRQTRIVGRFDNKEEAIIARLKAEKEHYGELAPQKHLFKEYGIE